MPLVTKELEFLIHTFSCHFVFGFVFGLIFFIGVLFVVFVPNFLGY
jgi:hypothetical protein